MNGFQQALDQTIPDPKLQAYMQRLFAYSMQRLPVNGIKSAADTTDAKGNKAAGVVLCDVQ